MGMTAEQRIAVVPEFGPEMCSLDIESMNFSVFPLAEKIKEWKYPWEKLMMELSRDFVFKNTFSDLEVFTKAMKKHNVKPEIGIYGTNGLYNTGFLVRTGQLDLPVHIQVFLKHLWAGGRLSLSGDVLGRPDQVHSEGPGFADKGANSTAPALFPGVDDSLQLLRAFYLAHIDCVKLASL
jgi:hypothetical protein